MRYRVPHRRAATQSGLTQVLELMWKRAAIVLIYAWGLLMCWAMAYYGSFVWETPGNMLGSEARMGVAFAFLNGLP